MPDAYANGAEDYADFLDEPNSLMHDYVKAAQDSRVREIDAAIRRFRECGVEIERFSIQEHPDETLLCVDGIPRFSWHMNLADNGALK